MLAKSAWAALIPHQGAMSLLDAVQCWDGASIHASSHSHRDPANPLRSEDGLHAVHLCEYGAQAMAIHGALLAQHAGGMARPGLLVALREVQLHVARIDQLPQALEIVAERLLASETNWQYRFRIRHAGQLLAAGRATVMLGSSDAPRDDNDATGVGNE